MAMTMTNSKVSVATELGVNKGSLSTISSTSFTPGAVAYAFKSDAAPNADVVFSNAQGAAVTSKVGPGWSLVAAPSINLNSTTVEAIIRVGAQAASQFTFIKGDTGGQPPLTVGEGVFVFSKAGGALQ
jgi:hypothetical protein